MNPSNWFELPIRFENPVLKFVLNVVGAVPKPVNPLPNPLLKPELKEVPEKFGLNTELNWLDGRVDVVLVGRLKSPLENWAEAIEWRVERVGRIGSDSRKEAGYVHEAAEEAAG